MVMNITQEGEEQRGLTVEDMEFLRWYGRYLSKERLFKEYGKYLSKEQLETYYSLIDKQQEINGKS